MAENVSAVPVLDFAITDNAAWPVPLQILDAAPSRNPVDLTGSTFRMALASAPGETVVLAIESGSGIDATDLAEGWITVHFPPDLPPGQYIGEMLRTEDEVDTVLFEATVTVRAGVTT